jgi:hypothetical protein
MFLPQSEQSSVTPIQSNRQNYISLKLFIFGRQEILQQMITSTRSLQSALNLIPNGILIRYNCYQIFDLFHPFKAFII